MTFQGPSPGWQLPRPPPSGVAPPAPSTGSTGRFLGVVVRASTSRKRYNLFVYDGFLVSCRVPGTDASAWGFLIGFFLVCGIVGGVIGQYIGRSMERKKDAGRISPLWNIAPTTILSLDRSNFTIDFRNVAAGKILSSRAGGKILLSLHDGGKVKLRWMKYPNKDQDVTSLLRQATIRHNQITFSKDRQGLIAVGILGTILVLITAGIFVALANGT